MHQENVNSILKTLKPTLPYFKKYGTKNTQKITSETFCSKMNKSFLIFKILINHITACYYSLFSGMAAFVTCT